MNGKAPNLLPKPNPNSLQIKEIVLKLLECAVKSKHPYLYLRAAKQLVSYLSDLRPAEWTQQKGVQSPLRSILQYLTPFLIPRSTHHLAFEFLRDRVSRTPAVPTDTVLCCILSLPVNPLEDIIYGKYVFDAILELLEKCDLNAQALSDAFRRLKELVAFPSNWVKLQPTEKIAQLVRALHRVVEETGDITANGNAALAMDILGSLGTANRSFLHIPNPVDAEQAPHKGVVVDIKLEGMDYTLSLGFNNIIDEALSELYVHIYIYILIFFFFFLKKRYIRTCTHMQISSNQKHWQVSKSRETKKFCAYQTVKSLVMKLVWTSEDKEWNEKDETGLQVPYPEWKETNLNCFDPDQFDDKTAECLFKSHAHQVSKHNLFKKPLKSALVCLFVSAADQILAPVVIPFLYQLTQHFALLMATQPLVLLSILQNNNNAVKGQIESNVFLEVLFLILGSMHHAWRVVGSVMLMKLLDVFTTVCGSVAGSQEGSDHLKIEACRQCWLFEELLSHTNRLMTQPEQYSLDGGYLCITIIVHFLSSNSVAQWRSSAPFHSEWKHCLFTIVHLLSRCCAKQPNGPPRCCIVI
ncbi:hypothetical protein RFI_20433, partial [Reticulomyxa filosa]